MPWMVALALLHALAPRQLPLPSTAHPAGVDGKLTARPMTNSTPSLSISEIGGKVLVKCHAGCSQAEVLAAMRHRGLWWSRRARPFGPEPQLVTDDGAAGRQSYAISLWETAMDARGTLVETYLGARGVTISPPAALRFRPAVKHTPTGLWWPAMIALVADVCGRAHGHPPHLPRSGRPRKGRCAGRPAEDGPGTLPRRRSPSRRARRRHSRPRRGHRDGAFDHAGPRHRRVGDARHVRDEERLAAARCPRRDHRA